MTWFKDEDIASLREEYLRIEMPGMVALIDHLVEREKAGKPVVTIGSSTIDLHGLMECKNMNEREMFETVFFRLNSLHFGSKKKPPLIDIAEAGPILEAAPPEARRRIDSIVGEFARIGRMVAKAKLLQFGDVDGNMPTTRFDDDFEEVDPMTADDIELPKH